MRRRATFSSRKAGATCPPRCAPPPCSGAWEGGGRLLRSSLTRCPPPTSFTARQIDEKYTSRAAKMYRTHLAKAAGAGGGSGGGSGKGGDGHSDDEAETHGGWGSGGVSGGGGAGRREGAGSSGTPASTGSGGGPRASPPALGRGISDSSVASAGPLSSEFLDRSVAKAVSAAFAAEQAETAAMRPLAVRETEAPATAAEVYAMHTHAGHGAGGVSGSVGAGGVTASGPTAIGVLDVSAITGDASSPSGEGVSTGAGAVKKPIVIGSAARAGGLGAKKLGATKLGATKLGTPAAAAAGATGSITTTGKLSVAGFGDDEFSGGTVEVAAAPPPAAAAPTVAAAPATSEPARPKAAMALSSKPAGDGLSEEYTRFAGAKAISSSQMYSRPEDDDAVREASARLASMGSVKAISSDMLFGGGGGARGRGESSHSDGSGGRWASRAGSEGMSDFVEKLGAAVGDDLRKVSTVVADKASRLRDGMSAFMDAMRR